MHGPVPGKTIEQSSEFAYPSCAWKKGAEGKTEFTGLVYTTTVESRAGMREGNSLLTSAKRALGVPSDGAS